MKTTLVDREAQVYLSVYPNFREHTATFDRPYAYLGDMTINGVAYQNVNMHVRDWDWLDEKTKAFTGKRAYAKAYQVRDLRGGLTDAAHKRVLATYEKAFLAFVRERWDELRQEALTMTSDQADRHKKRECDGADTVIRIVRKKLYVTEEPPCT